MTASARYSPRKPFSSQQFAHHPLLSAVVRQVSIDLLLGTRDAGAISDSGDIDAFPSSSSIDLDLLWVPLPAFFSVFFF